MSENTANILLTRDKVEERYKWKLEHIYSSIDDWQRDYDKVKEMLPEVAGFKGTLSKNSENMLACFKKADEIMMLSDRIFVYARMKRDEDNSNTEFQALTDKAFNLSTQVYAAVSFITPEITAMSEDAIRQFIKENSELAVYEHFLEEILRQKEHVLSDKEEQLLALSLEMAEASHDIFSMFNNADLKFPIIKDEEGNDVELTKGRYIKFLESHDRRVRKDAFDAMYSTFGKFKNTLGATLLSNVKKDKFYASVRKYDSCLHASLDSDNVSTDVYDKLIETVNRNLPLLHRYLRLRKKALKLDELHMYDIYVPIVEMPKKTIPYDVAVSMVIDGLRPLGEDYMNDLQQAFKDGWIDVYETQGKTSGAYSWGTYTSHPYVLLNYQDTINDVFTLAHELGHAMHTYYTNKTQPYVYSQYRIFVAEVASTLNEALLTNYLISNTSDPKEKAYILNHHLEEFRGTVFRQVMFAEFEKIIHEKAEKGESLAAQTLCDIYYELNKKYFGEEVHVDKEIAMEWARIPHFYSSFYVYKYATGFSAALSIAKQILNKEPGSLERYKQFLSSGGSDYPINLLKKAGVDLTTPKPAEDAMAVFEETLSKLEELISYT